jgi:AraC-like DNA-binding protein
MDPLSDVLSLLKPQSYMFGGFDIGGDFSVQFAGHPGGIKCYSVVSGECWLVVDTVPEPVLLKAGDCFLLPRGLSFCLTSDLALPSVDVFTMLTSPPNGQIRRWNGGGKFFSVGGYFHFGGKNAEILLGALPPIVHIRKEPDKAALRWSMDQIMQELREPQPGGYLVAQQLAYMLLIQALRLHLAEGSNGGVSWLFALADRQMSAAIHAMHNNPAHHWTLQELAQHAGMSRSIFAQKFKERVGASPIEYLTRWRMLVAADKLVNSEDSISAIALALGYESESAFSTAFKREMGCSPRQYGRGRKQAAPAPVVNAADVANRFQPVAS